MLPRGAYTNSKWPEARVAINMAPGTEARLQVLDLD